MCFKRQSIHLFMLTNNKPKTNVHTIYCHWIICFCFILRQSFMYPRLGLNSLCSWGWRWTWFSCLHCLSARARGVHIHAQFMSNCGWSPEPCAFSGSTPCFSFSLTCVFVCVPQHVHMEFNDPLASFTGFRLPWPSKFWDYNREPPHLTSVLSSSPFPSTSPLFLSFWQWRIFASSLLD